MFSSFTKRWPRHKVLGVLHQTISIKPILVDRRWFDFKDHKSATTCSCTYNLHESSDETHLKWICYCREGCCLSFLSVRSKFLNEKSFVTDSVPFCRIIHGKCNHSYSKADVNYFIIYTMLALEIEKFWSVGFWSSGSIISNLHM